MPSKFINIFIFLTKSAWSGMPVGLLVGVALISSSAAWGASPDPQMKTLADAAISQQRVAHTKHNGLKLEEVSQLLLKGGELQYEALILEFEKNWEFDPIMEFEFHRFFNSIDRRNANLLAALDRWVARHPSYISYTARGSYFSRRGQYLRGDRYAHETPALNIELMEKLLTQAKSDLEQAIKLKPSFIPAYTELIEASKFSRKLNIDALQLLSEISKVRPDCLLPRESYLETLEPRWGGSHKEMTEFVDSIIENARHNPLIWMLNGDVYFEKYQSRPRGQLIEGVEDLTEALKYAESNRYLEARGVAYWRAKNYPAAIADFSKCVANNPDGSNNCKGHLDSLTKLQKQNELSREQKAP
jgi:tetratricopeptide (TPR) repeat protein